MDPRVRGLYKNLLFATRQCPGVKFSDAKARLRKAFTEELRIGGVEDKLKQGDFVFAEIRALIMLHKYRSMKNRHLDWSTRRAPSCAATLPSLLAIPTTLPDLPNFLEPPTTLTEAIELYGTEFAFAAFAALAVVSYTNRPKGWARTDILSVQDSGIAGLGLFAKQPIPGGTVLGAYPGRPRSAVEMTAKAETAPLARQYVFRTDDGRYLDPTDIEGKPCPRPAPGPMWPADINIALAYANEPPVGSAGPNASLEDGETPLDILFVASRDIVEGEEIFIDYGKSYDRGGYKKPV
eukprot:gene24179-9769_t